MGTQELLYVFVLAWKIQPHSSRIHDLADSHHDVSHKFHWSKGHPAADMVGTGSEEGTFSEMEKHT